MAKRSLSSMTLADFCRQFPDHCAFLAALCFVCGMLVGGCVVGVAWSLARG